jgi:three-Cys-motif partner protein
VTPPPDDSDDFVGDEIGDWSEIKLEIIKKYATAYSQILSNQEDPPFHHVYIDGFAGAGRHRSRTTGEIVPGSPTNALEVRPPFREYHFVDLNRVRLEALRRIADERDDVYLYEADANDVLLHQVFPKVRYEDYRRALCLLDPYGMQLDWRVLEAAGQARSIEVNRNVLRRDAQVDPVQAVSLTRVWGDESWRDIAYGPPAQRNLFELDLVEKRDNEAVAQAFRQRLREVGGFEHVADPIPMLNARGATVYYLYFASQRPVARDIVDQIFNAYRR